MGRQAFQHPDVEAVFAGYRENLRVPLARLRQLIFEVAEQTDGVGELEETLKWGQVSYLTPVTKSGTTIRIDQRGKSQYALFVNCKSSLIDDWRQRYPALEYEGNRSIVFNAGEELPREILSHCIAMALTYHLRKKS